jgi:hypothetical protein
MEQVLEFTKCEKEFYVAMSRCDYWSGNRTIHSHTHSHTLHIAHSPPHYSNTHSLSCLTQSREWMFSAEEKPLMRSTECNDRLCATALRNSEGRGSIESLITSRRFVIVEKQFAGDGLCDCVQVLERRGEQ